MSERPEFGTRRWRRLSKAIVQRDGGWCQLRYEKCRSRATTADHIVRPEEGGAFWDPANLQAACVSCNVAKRNRLLARARWADRARGGDGQNLRPW